MQPTSGNDGLQGIFTIGFWVQRWLISYSIGIPSQRKTSNSVSVLSKVIGRSKNSCLTKTVEGRRIMMVIRNIQAACITKPHLGIPIMAGIVEYVLKVLSAFLPAST